MEIDLKSIEKCENEESRQETDDPTDGTSQIVEDLSAEYSEYLKINNEDEFSKFSTTVEEMLAKLDEFGGIVDRIRSDTSICMNDALPLIQNKCNEMEAVFQKVDNLEKFVLLVKENVATMEGELVKAEDEMGSFSGLKKMLSSFVSPKRIQTKATKPIDYVPPHLFNTKDFIDVKPSEGTEEAASKT